MLKFLIGPVLVAGGYLAGSVYGRDAEQLVHKSPSVAYAALEQALGNVRPTGTTFFDGGTPTPYELKVERTLDQRLVVTLFFSGRQGAEADLTFTPRNDGKDTLISAKIHSDHSVLRTVLAGTSKARLAYAPDWMLNLTLKPVLEQLATKIEEGEVASFDGLTPADAEARWESNLSSDQREEASQWQLRERRRELIRPDPADAPVELPHLASARAG